MDEIKAQQFCCHQLIQRCLNKQDFVNASFGLQYQPVKEFEFCASRCRNYIDGCLLGAGPGSVVTVTPEWVGQVSWSVPSWRSYQTLSGWRINALLHQGFPACIGGAIRSKCIVRTPSPYFLARWLWTPNKATRSRDEDLQRRMCVVICWWASSRWLAKTTKTIENFLGWGARKRAAYFSVYILCIVQKVKGLVGEIQNKKKTTEQL